ncbi:proton channel OTOP3-like [Hippoglossus hippoglossus]|uniref:proton channel OTOP3-like n=1 Tax=Hippoglossus hippoglossus TaxID=8267 RepID=UPI00148D5B20|nr:proton channel OTOP3-like [Hippoglossus hippoglossus]XP_034426929.1 proton channel OTOP3-like [Hippoglossus hippoglossus]XP_034426930.1 proton channel OTOP3-like [Hippoglossus hippoglossus]XP_047194409.1 proton channel OTOP3 [Hippoglossus stenolepis]XP_047194410.1 proton channel OTOP3 [Hippoglossus stenolepis]
MNPDPGATEMEYTCVTPGNPTDDEPETQELDPVLVWVPSGRRLISGLLGMNVVLLGAALVAGQAFNPEGLKNQEPQVFLLLLMGASLIWILWYLLWARRQPGISPHKDHHAGGTTVTLVLILFAAFSVLLFICRIGYLISVRVCQPPAKVLSAFMEAPFLVLQTYLLWAHSKDCVHKHKIITRSGLMVILSADLLLWLNAVTEDTIHEEIELEKSDGFKFGNTNSSEADDSDSAGNLTFCRCSASAACLTFRKGFEILYPFNMEFYLMAGCMIYVMWKNVGRRTSPGHHVSEKLTLNIVYQGGVIYGLVFGGLVLVAGVTVFILYQVWVSQQQLRLTAFLIFYGFHCAVMPVMSLCSLAGTLVHRLERRAQEAGLNPTRSLDVLLLVAAALGQLALSYFSLVAALALGTSGPLGDLDLSYSLLSLLELVLQNIFIIEGLHRHPNLLVKKKEKQRSSIFKPKKKVTTPIEDKKADLSLLEGNTSAPPAVQLHDGKKSWHKRAIQEICAFLVLSNIMLWVIPAFGAHPQFENGLGKQFFGFSTWFVLVNLGQPLSVFYRMHSVGALMELLITA